MMKYVLAVRNSASVVDLCEETAALKGFRHHGSRVLVHLGAGDPEIAVVKSYLQAGEQESVSDDASLCAKISCTIFDPCTLWM
jgi:hypothetical protein